MIPVRRKLMKLPEPDELFEKEWNNFIRKTTINGSRMFNNSAIKSVAGIFYNLGAINGINEAERITKDSFIENEKLRSN